MLSSPPSAKPVTAAIAALAFAILTWASTFPITRVLVPAFGGIPLAAARFALAGLIAVVVLLVRRTPLPARHLWPRLLVVGVLSMAVYPVLFNSGQGTMASGPAAFLIQTLPLFTAVIAWVLLGEKPGARLAIGSAICLAGVGCIAIAKGGGTFINPGAPLLVGAAFITALAYVLQKPLLEVISPLELTCWLMVIGGITLSPALPSALETLAQSPPAHAMMLAYLAIVPAFLAYIAWAVALKTFTATRATNALFLIPIVASVMGALWLGEVPGSLDLLGGALVIVGVMVVNSRRG